MKTLFLLLFFTGIGLSLIAQTSHFIQVQDNSFSPSNLTIEVGDTVFWVNVGGDIHTSTSGDNCVSDGTWDSGNMSPGDTFMLVFENTGTFPYYCIPHCGMGMTGSITVDIVNSIQERVFLKDSRIVPNPAAGNTNVSLTLPYSTNISIAVFNAAGIKLKNGMNVQMLEAGDHTIPLDTENLSPGYYFVKIYAEDSAPMILPLMVAGSN